MATAPFAFKREYTNGVHTVSDSESDTASESASESASPRAKRLRTDSSSAADASDPEPKAAQFAGQLFLTRVAGVDAPSEFREFSLSEILSAHTGELLESVQFNYMFEIDWLVQQYPAQYRSLPLTLVHGDRGAAKAAIDVEAMRHSHVTLVQARLDIPYGTHHSKMMLLRYSDGLRVVVHTANLIQRDWFQKTQSGWMSAVLPRRPGDSSTRFGADLQSYLQQYRHARLANWAHTVGQHDFSDVNLFLVPSCPGRFSGQRLCEFGHLKLRRSLQQFSFSAAGRRQLVAQFSSIGSLGADSGAWLTAEFLRSLAADSRQPEGAPASDKSLQLIFPTKDDVRHSLEGYPGGCSLPYSSGVARRQPWLLRFLYRWCAEKSHRSLALPHMKSYLRYGDGAADWYLVTSANLSKAAWGCMEKKATQLMVRSYEMGVLLVAQLAGCDSFELRPRAAAWLPVPYDLPPLPYGGKDRPWVVDEACPDRPDSHGNVWCPPPQ